MVKAVKASFTHHYHSQPHLPALCGNESTISLTVLTWNDDYDLVWMVYLQWSIAGYRVSKSACVYLCKLLHKYTCSNMPASLCMSTLWKKITYCLEALSLNMIVTTVLGIVPASRLMEEPVNCFGWFSSSVSSAHKYLCRSSVDILQPESELLS